MKKLSALVLAMVMVMCISVTAFAATSPVGDQVFNITFINGTNANSSKEVISNGKTFTLNSDTSKGTFNSWSFYKKDYTAAVEGVDYAFVSGNKNSATAEIKPLVDGLIICGNYDGKITDPKGSGTNNEGTSPVTGDVALVYFGVIMMAAAACGVVAKKQLAK